MAIKDAALAKAPSNAAIPSQGRRRMKLRFHELREVHASIDMYSKTVGKGCFCDDSSHAGTFRN